MNMKQKNSSHTSLDPDTPPDEFEFEMDVAIDIPDAAEEDADYRAFIELSEVLAILRLRAQAGL